MILPLCIHITTTSRTPGCFPGGSAGKEYACNAGDPGLIPGSGRSLGEGIGDPLQYSWAFLVAQTVKNPPAVRETWVQSLGWEDPLEQAKGTLSPYLCHHRLALPVCTSWLMSTPFTAHLWDSSTLLHGLMVNFCLVFYYGAGDSLLTKPWPTLCNPMDRSPPGFSAWDFPGKNTGVGFHFLLQIYPTQGSNAHLLHCRWILYHLSQQEAQYSTM